MFHVLALICLKTQARPVVCKILKNTNVNTYGIQSYETDDSIITQILFSCFIFLFYLKFLNTRFFFLVVHLFNFPQFFFYSTLPIHAFLKHFSFQPIKICKKLSLSLNNLECRRCADYESSPMFYKFSIQLSVFILIFGLIHQN